MNRIMQGKRSYECPCYFTFIIRIHINSFSRPPVLHIITVDISEITTVSFNTLSFTETLFYFFCILNSCVSWGCNTDLYNVYVYWVFFYRYNSYDLLASVLNQDPYVFDPSLFCAGPDLCIHKQIVRKP
jgi:hypothetical protein